MPCSKGMTACYAQCAHRTHVRNYQQERQRQERDIEDRWRELDGAEDAPRAITFHDWLIHHKRPPDELEQTA